MSDGQSSTLTKTPPLSEETWQSIFLLLVEILTKALDSSQCHNTQDGLDKFLDNFFDIWFLACSKQYPNPSFWKSLDRILKQNSLHYNTLRSWSSQFLGLNQKVVEMIVKIESDKSGLHPLSLDSLDCQQLVHTWYRFFHFPINPALLLEYNFPINLASQVPKLENDQVRFYSLLALKIASTVTSAVYQFMGMPYLSAIRGQLLVATITADTSNSTVNGSVTNHQNATGTTQQAFTAGLSRRSNRSNNAIKNEIDKQATKEVPVEGSKMFDYPLFVKSSRVQTSADSMLDAFGDFLFKVCLTGPGTSNELVYSQAESLTCLLRLFSWKRNTESVNLQYYSIFNCCLFKALNLQFETSNCDVTAYVILSSCNLLCNGVRFSSQLVPTYVNRIFQYCSEENEHLQSSIANPGSNKVPSSIRCHVPVTIFWKACYYILLSSFPYFVKFSKVNNDQIPFPTYLEKVHDFCTKRLVQEKDPQSISLLISLLHSLIQISSGRGFLGSKLSIEGASYREAQNYKVISLLIRKAFLEWSDEAQGHPILTALAFLRTLARCSNFSSDSVRQLVVSKLCELIEKLLQKPARHHKTALHSLIVSSYRTIAIWLHNRPSVFNCEKLFKPVLESIEYGISGSKSVSNDAYVYKEVKAQRVPSQRCNDAAEILLNCLVNSRKRRKRKQLDLKKREESENKLQLFYISGKERVVHVEEECSSDSTEADEEYTRENLTVSVSTPFGNETYRVFDRNTSDLDKRSTATIIPARKLGCHNDITWNYIPGKVPFIPEPLADAIFTKPEEKLSSLRGESCSDKDFSSLISDSINTEQDIVYSKSYKTAIVCTEPTPVEGLLHTKKFVAKFPFLQPTKVESQDFKSNTNLEALQSKSQLCETGSNVSEIELSHSILQALPLKMTQVVDVLYLSEDSVTSGFLNSEQIYLVQREAKLKGKLKHLIESLDNFSSSSGENMKMAEDPFCDIFYNCFPENPIHEYNNGVLPGKLSVNSNIVTQSCQAGSANQPKFFVYLFAIENFDQYQHLDPSFVSNLINSGKTEKEPLETTSYVFYSFYVHSNSLITIYIDSNVKNVSFHPLVDKCVIRSEDFASSISKSIRSCLFDWSIEHITPCAKRRDFIQRFGGKMKNEMLTKEFLWDIRNLTSVNSK